MGMKITAKELYQLEQYVLANYINKLIINEDKNSYVKENDLIKLNLKAEELAYIKQVLKKHNIYLIPQTKEEIIVQKDREKLVRNYTYGNIQESKIETIDKPVMATLEYDSAGNLIYEDWQKLEEFLEKEFIPEYVSMKQRKDKETKEITYFPSIQLNKIVQLQFSEAEVKYIIEYLNKEGIHVGGIASTVDGEFENYDYVRTYKSGKLPECVTAQETLQKFARYKNNPTKELRDEIIVDNMRLATFLSYRYAMITKLDIHEIESFAYEGLIKAVEGFDLSHGCKFSTYAYPTIRGNILGGLAEIKGYKRGEFYTNFIQAKLAVEEELETTIEENPELIDDVVELLVVTGKISEKNQEDIKRRILLQMPGSLDEMMDDKEVSPDNSDEYLSNDYTNEDLAQDNLLYLQVMRKFARETIDDKLDTLCEREKETLIERFGLRDDMPKILDEVGAIFDVSRERARQLEGKALRKLRHPYRSRALRDFMEAYNEYSYEPNKILDIRTGIENRKHY